MSWDGRDLEGSGGIVGGSAHARLMLGSCSACSSEEDRSNSSEVPSIWNAQLSDRVDLEGPLWRRCQKNLAGSRSVVQIELKSREMGLHNLSHANEKDRDGRGLGVWVARTLPLLTFGRRGHWSPMRPIHPGKMRPTPAVQSWQR